MTTTAVTLSNAGYVTAGDTIVRPGGVNISVVRWEMYGREVAVFEASGERYLFGRYESVTLLGTYPARVA